MKLITRETLCSYLPRRDQGAHKGSFGRVLVVAGSRTMCGAGLLCAKSVLTAGAGMVFWALPQSMQPAFAAALPEAITLPLPESEQGELAEEGFSALLSFVEKHRPSLAVLGPGLGKSPLLSKLLFEINLPLVVDADALNYLAASGAWAEKWPRQTPCIFTPHPGEMARLLQSRVAVTEEDRLQQVESLCRKTNGVSILKGAGTLVCAPEGEGVSIWKNTTGGPALSKAGSGDVLAGIIAGLWAQLGTAEGVHMASALKAALCGVYLHGLAGDLAALKRSDYGVLARDTAESLPQAFLEVLK